MSLVSTFLYIIMYVYYLVYYIFFLYICFKFVLLLHILHSISFHFPLDLLQTRIYTLRRNFIHIIYCTLIVLNLLPYMFLFHFTLKLIILCY